MKIIKKILSLTLLTGIVFASSLAISMSFLHAEVSIALGSVGRDTQVMRGYLDMWEKETGKKASIVSLPASTTDQFGQYKTWLGAKNKDVDIYALDVIWATQIDRHFVDLSRVAAEEAKLHFPAIIKSQMVGKKLVALPAFTDAPMLYYRSDLLTKYNESPPKTWRDLQRIAKKIMDGERAAGNSKFYGFVFQGSSYEGLTCDALEWISSYGGGQIVEANGKISINNAKAAKALDLIATFVGNISPEGVLSYMEEESRGVWQTGNAAFMRNWPYAYSLGNSSDSPIKGKFDVVTLPEGEGNGARSAATLGGWNLGVSVYSENKREAIELVKFLTGKRIQKLNAVNESKLPTIPELYEDADVLKTAPFFATMKDVLANSVGRPSGATRKKYNEVSKEFWTAVHAVISGRKNGSESLADLEKRLKRVRGRRW